MSSRKSVTAEFVTQVTVTDPESRGGVDLEIWRDPQSGALVGIDASFLDQVRESIPSPYNEDTDLMLPWGCTVSGPSKWFVFEIRSDHSQGETGDLKLCLVRATRRLALKINEVWNQMKQAHELNPMAHQMSCLAEFPVWLGSEDPDDKITEKIRSAGDKLNPGERIDDVISGGSPSVYFDADGELDNLNGDRVDVSSMEITHEGEVWFRCSPRHSDYYVGTIAVRIPTFEQACCAGSL